MNKRIVYGLMAGGGIIGVLAAFIQTTEKIALLKNKDTILACDVNSVFSCTNVLHAWQSSVFGFPNSLMCVVLFTAFTSVAVVGLSGGTLPRAVRLMTQGLSLFMLGFALWFLTQSIYVIGALCILCIFCFGGLLLVNWGWLRLNTIDMPVGEPGRRFLQRHINSGADVFFWVLLALLVAFAMILRFR